MNKMPGSYTDIEYYCKRCGVKLKFNNMIDFCHECYIELGEEDQDPMA